ncbi:hypothetical protein V1478_001288 [Vespula squamosa]|uniref:Uncharacterized protein n=1 Tax=Vespula squamosa TaxID=30214 RepID=A0ABD2C108_VESSQ
MSSASSSAGQPVCSATRCFTSRRVTEDYTLGSLLRSLVSDDYDYDDEKEEEVEEEEEEEEDDDDTIVLDSHSPLVDESCHEPIAYLRSTNESKMIPLAIGETAKKLASAAPVP